jgi:hypothetical protein
MRNYVTVIGLIGLAVFHSTEISASAASFSVSKITPGPTPYISQVTLKVANLKLVNGLQFTIQPKAGSKTKPVSATYTLSYLKSQGYVNQSTSEIIVPVFGLYQDYNNTVSLNTVFPLLKGGFASGPNFDKLTIQIRTPTGIDYAYRHPTILKYPDTKDLSYSFIQLKSWAYRNAPIILDTDSEVRWVGTAGVGTPSSILYDNAFYISNGGSGLIREEWDGRWSFVKDYSNAYDVTYTGHHNFDPGKKGIILEVDTTQWTECVALEVGKKGEVFSMWNFADIIKAAMLEGGENLGTVQGFVRLYDDWFHNNSVTYNKWDNSIIASGREDFVICVNYDTKKIKWILGDTTKAWYQNFTALRKYSLTLEGTSLPPIGQHALSITSDGCLLLHDNGLQSFNQSPVGNSRFYSAARKYQINPTRMTAKEIWKYDASQSVYSPICSSVYEDAPNNYLIDFASVNWGQNVQLHGLDAKGKVAFIYRYDGCDWSSGWNSIPVHMENILFQ